MHLVDLSKIFVKPVRFLTELAEKTTKQDQYLKYNNHFVQPRTRVSKLAGVALRHSPDWRLRCGILRK